MPVADPTTYNAQWRKRNRVKLRLKARQYYDTVTVKKRRAERQRDIEWMNRK